jgi:hypothetical protein
MPEDHQKVPCMRDLPVRLLLQCRCVFCLVCDICWNVVLVVFGLKFVEKICFLIVECQKNDWSMHKFHCRKPEARCQVCDDVCVKLFYCSGCKVNFYCSTDCQQKDWPKHKFWCPSGKEVLHSPQNTNHYFARRPETLAERIS